MATENLLIKYVEVDANNKFLLTTSRCTATYLQRNDNNHYVYKDFGTGFFGTSFKHECTAYFSSFEPGAATAQLMIFYMLSNVLGDGADQLAYPGNYIFLDIYRSSAGGGGTRWFYCETGLTSEATNNCNLETKYYFTITRNNTNAIIDIYSDSARTSLIWSMSVALNSTFFRYFFPGSSYYQVATAYISGYGENYDLNTNLCPLINIYNDAHDVFLNMPNSLVYNDGRELQTFNFWSNADIRTRDIGKNTENIIINGTEQGSFVSDAYTSMASMDILVEDGQKITISGTGLDAVDTTWYVEGFSYDTEPGIPNMVNWSLSLEKAY